jgi:hypothetical protein
MNTLRVQKPGPELETIALFSNNRIQFPHTKNAIITPSQNNALDRDPISFVQLKEGRI